MNIYKSNSGCIAAKPVLDADRLFDGTHSNIVQASKLNIKVTHPTTTRSMARTVFIKASCQFKQDKRSKPLTCTFHPKRKLNIKSSIMDAGALSPPCLILSFPFLPLVVGP
jgi:hypothetical protein